MENYKILIIALMISVLLVILLGLAMLAFGKKYDPKITTRLMYLRVALQGLVIIILVAVILFRKNIF